MCVPMCELWAVSRLTLPFSWATLPDPPPGRSRTSRRGCGRRRCTSRSGWPGRTPRRPRSRRRSRCPCRPTGGTLRSAWVPCPWAGSCPRASQNLQKKKKKKKKCHHQYVHLKRERVSDWAHCCMLGKKKDSLRAQVHCSLCWIRLRVALAERLLRTHEIQG